MDVPNAGRSSAPSGGVEVLSSTPEVVVVDEFLQAKQDLSRRWSKVFIGQNTPDWPSREGVNDAIISAIERLDMAREQYYKERLQVDCLERLCDAMMVVPVTTFMDHSVSSGYLHHLQSSMANLGIKELSLTDLDCKRRQTFSGVADVKQQGSAFGRASQRRSRRLASPGSGGSGGSGGRASSTAPLSTPALSTGLGVKPNKSSGDEHSLVVAKEGTDARRLSLVNYFASKRGASDEKTEAPRLKSNMRKSFNKKAASFLGRTHIKMDTDSDSAASPVETHSVPHMRSNSESTARNMGAAGRRGSSVMSQGRLVSKASLSSLPDTSSSVGMCGKDGFSSLTSAGESPLSLSERRPFASTVAVDRPDVVVGDGSGGSDGGNGSNGSSSAGGHRSSVGSTRSVGAASASLDVSRSPSPCLMSIEVPSRGASSTSDEMSAFSLRSDSASPGCAASARADAGTPYSEIGAPQESPDDGGGEGPVAGFRRRSVTTGDLGMVTSPVTSPRSSMRGMSAGRRAPAADVCGGAAATSKIRSPPAARPCSDTSPERRSLPAVAVAGVSGDTSPEHRSLPAVAVAGVSSGGGSQQPLPQISQPDAAVRPKGLVRSTRSMGSTLDEEKSADGRGKVGPRDVRKVKLASRPTAPVHTGAGSSSSSSSSSIKDEKSQVLLERINTLTRRNRIMSMRRRGCGGAGADNAASTILTAESVGTMDFTRMAIAGFADSEKIYRNTLRTVYFNYYKPLNALASTSQPICSVHEVDTIFYNMEELYSLHNLITLSLEPLVESDFMALNTLPHTFRILMPKLDFYRSYKDNFHKAIETVGRLRAESSQFQAFLDNASQIKMKGRRVEPLEEMLRSPMGRLESYRSVLSDLCNSDLKPDEEDTSVKHDVKELQQLLDRLTAYINKMLDSSSSSSVPEKQIWERKLVKTVVCVELHEGKRKFRHVCLFNDVIMCATRARAKSKGGSHNPHDCKWFLPLEELTWHPPTDVPMDPITPVTPTTTAELSQYQGKINKLKGDLKHSDQARKKFGLKHDRERKRKNLQDLEVMFKMLQHNQIVRLFSRTGKVHTLLFVEQAEKADWTDTIERYQSGPGQRPPHASSISAVDINQMLFLAKSAMQKHEEEVKAYVEDEDVELLDGLLVVLVDCAYGLKSKGKTDIFSQLEVDTYGRLERKAKTKCVPYSIKPEWDQGFEVELESAHSLTVQIYESKMLSDNSIAKGIIDLVSSGLLDQEIHTIDLPLQPQGQLSMKLQYLTPEMMLKRSEMMKANTTTAVFGVPLQFVTMRESNLVPNIIRLCAQEVEFRGLEETGVYRISGLASEVKMLREAFDTDIEQAAKLVKEVDIHAVTGALKLFLREMPEPLFPRVLYSRFVEGSNLSNLDSRVSCMVSLLYSMPDTNLLTTLYLIKHLKSVAEVSSTNKMPTSNLATVIGPNVLKPIDDGADRIVLDIGNQVAIFGFFLDLRLDLLEPEERDVDGQSVQEVLSSTSISRITGIIPSRSNDSLGFHHISSGRESPQGMRRGYLDIHSKN